MIDPVLERNTYDCHQLLEEWRIFHDYYNSAVKGEGLTKDREEQFLEVKSKIAMLHDSFMNVLKVDQRIGQSVLIIVSRAITLQHVARMSVAEVKKTESEWHEAFLLLQETLGNLEDERARLAGISETAHKADQARKAMRNRVNAITGSNTFKGAVIVLVILFATVGVQVLGIWNWSNLKDYPATRSVFYAIYDGGLRFIKDDIPYFRLDNLEHPAEDADESRGILGSQGIEGWWIISATATQNRAVSNFRLNDEINQLGLPDSSASEIRGAENKVFWFHNDRDYMALACVLMETSSQAERLAQEIRDTIQDRPAGTRVGTNTRANLLQIVFYRIRDNQSADDLDNFVQAAPALVK